MRDLGTTVGTILRSIYRQFIFAILFASGLVIIDWKFPVATPAATAVSEPAANGGTPNIAAASTIWTTPVFAPTTLKSEWEHPVFRAKAPDWATPSIPVIPDPPPNAPQVQKAPDHAATENAVRQNKGLLAKLSFRPDSVLGILSMLAPMAATMLGLYFAAVGLVVSTSYNRVPGRVRALFVREQVGSHYFTLLAQFGANTLLLLLAYTIGLPIGVWSVCLLLLLGAAGLFSFIQLGLRTFAFLDPAELVSVLNPMIARSFSAVAAGGYGWENRDFQDFHRGFGRFYLSCYDTFIGLADQSTSSGDSLVALAGNLLGVLRHYSANKSRIPSNSQWFPRVPKHRNWLTSSYAGLEVARATDTGLQPEMVPDYSWFEQDAADLLARILRVLLERKDFRSANLILNDALVYLGELGASFNIQDALRISRALGVELDSVIRKFQLDLSSDAGLERCALYVSLFDVQGLGLISVLLGLVKTLRETQPQQETKAVGRIDWQKSKTIYQTGGRPRPVLEQWETLRENLSFEFEVDGRSISPDWVLTECTALGYAQSLSGIVELWDECEKTR